MRALRIPLRIVFYPCDGQWVAHCLEFDLCGHGPDKPTAVQSLAEAVRLQLLDSIDSGNLRNLFTPADSDVFAKFAAGKDTADVAIGALSIELDQIRVELSECREYGEDDSERSVASLATA